VKRFQIADVMFHITILRTAIAKSRRCTRIKMTRRDANEMEKENEARGLVSKAAPSTPSPANRSYYHHQSSNLQPLQP
jgi:hypothetical protein